MVSGALSFASIVRASLGMAGCLLRKVCVPSVFAFFCFAALSLTRRRNSSLDRDSETCSTLTFTRFSMYRFPTRL